MHGNIASQHVCYRRFIWPMNKLSMKVFFLLVAFLDFYLINTGNFTRVNVLVIERRVIFVIEPGVRYDHDVRLSLLYTNANNPSKQQEVIPSNTYRNGSVITHTEYRTEVPFKRFTVRVRLMFSDGMLGPYIDVPGIHGKKFI